jgi:hypothetical protein
MIVSFLKFFRKSSFITYLMIGVLSISCSVQLPSSYIYTQDPKTNDLHKWPLITDDEENYRIELQALENVDQMLPFEVTITNKGEDTLYVDPGIWQLQYAKEYAGDSTRLDTASYPLTGIQVNEAYQDIAFRKEKAKKNTRTAIIIIGVVLIVGIIIIVASANSNEEKKEKKQSRRSGGGLNLNFGSNSSAREERPKNEEIAYLRRTGQLMYDMNLGPRSISPGNTQTFTLYFPRNKSMQYLILDGAINDQLLSWDFLHRTKDILR